MRGRQDEARDYGIDDPFGEVEFLSLAEYRELMRRHGLNDKNFKRYFGLTVEQWCRRIGPEFNHFWAVLDIAIMRDTNDCRIADCRRTCRCISPLRCYSVMARKEKAAA